MGAISLVRQFVGDYSTPGVSKASIEVTIPPVTAILSIVLPRVKFTMVPREPSLPPRFGPVLDFRAKAISHLSLSTVTYDSLVVLVPYTVSSSWS